MVILLFGVSNVGKTSIGRELANRMNYLFLDLDEEIKKKFHISLEKFMQDNPWPYERNMLKGKILGELIQNHDDKTVIAVSPIFYARAFNKLLNSSSVMVIELQDSEEHIFDRLVFSDENDVVYSDDEYKEKHREYYIREIHKDVIYVKRTFKKITNKYYIDNKPIEAAADELYNMIQSGQFSY